MSGVAPWPQNEYEESLLEEFSRRVGVEKGPWSLHPKTAEEQSIEFQSPFLEGDQGERTLVVYFKERKRPECLYGYRYQLYDKREDGLAPASQFGVNVLVGMLADEIREHIEAASLGLPVECSEGTVVWIAEDEA